MENSKEPTEISLELIVELSDVVAYKVNTQKNQSFFYQQAINNAN
jgi:hypothetical protein